MIKSQNIEEGIIYKSKSGLCHDGDLEIYMINNLDNGLCEYYLWIEGALYFNSLDKLKIFYKEIIDELEYWYINNFDYYDDYYYSETIIYRSYDIELHKDSNGYTVYVEPPTFYGLEDLYLWTKGMYNQLNNIKGLKHDKL